jgi:hypothetical protein
LQFLNRCVIAKQVQYFPNLWQGTSTEGAHKGGTKQAKRSPATSAHMTVFFLDMLKFSRRLGVVAFVAHVDEVIAFVAHAPNDDDVVYWYLIQ